MIHLGMLDVLKQVDTDEDGTKTVTYWGLTRGESIAAENAEPGSCQPSRAGTTRMWAVDDTGNSSVMPWITPRMKICR